MSLLNDMLKDLDGQRERNQQAGAEQAQAHNFNVKRWLLPSLAVLAVVYWLVVERNLLGLLPKPTESGLPPGYELNTNWAERLKAEQTAEHQAVALDASLTPGAGAVAISSVNTSVQLSEESTIGGEAAEEALAAQTPIAPGIEISDVPVPSQTVEVRPSALVSEPHFVAPHPQTAPAVLSAPQNPAKAEPRIERSDAGNDRMYANAIDEGRFDSVAGEAYAWLRQGSVIERTSIALTKYHFAQGDSDELLQVAAIVQPKHADLAAFAEAHWLALAGRVDEAIAACERVVLPSTVDAERVRLLAALHQLAGNHSEAHTLFAQLVGRPRATVNDWLGFAVASDKQGLTDGARQGFGQVLRLQHPDPNVQRYADQRYRQLTP